MLIPGPSTPLASCLVSSEPALDEQPGASSAPEAADGQPAVATASKHAGELLHSVVTGWQG